MFRNTLVILLLVTASVPSILGQLLLPLPPEEGEGWCRGAGLVNEVGWIELAILGTEDVRVKEQTERGWKVGPINLNEEQKFVTVAPYEHYLPEVGDRVVVGIATCWIAGTSTEAEKPFLVIEELGEFPPF